MTKTTAHLSLFVVVAALTVGCGQTENQDPNVGIEKYELEEVHEMYQQHTAMTQRPPAALSDLKESENAHPTAFQGVRQGKYIVVWGLNDTSGGTILAYEKDAPTNGGLAVMADGKVKRLDAQAFQALPKTPR